MDAIAEHFGAGYPSVTETRTEPYRLYNDKEIARGYAVDMKRVALAYAIEITIIVTSLIGAWLFTVMYGNNDPNMMLMMMLAPVAYGVVEFCRVPLALAVRKPTYGKFIKFVIVLGLLGAAFVTVKSVSQLGEIMFRPRLFDVVHARERLAEAESAVNLNKTQITDADALVTQRQAEAQAADAEVKTATENLAKIDGQKCSPISGVGRNGYRYQGMKCSTDPRLGPLKEAVNTATTHRANAMAKLNEVTAQRQAFDRTDVETVLRGEQTKYREAVMHSQLHSFTAMVFGKEPTEVTDGEVNVGLDRGGGPESEVQPGLLGRGTGRLLRGRPGRGQATHRFDDLEPVLLQPGT